MAQHKLPNFKIDKDNPTNGIKELIGIIKPFWKKNVIIENISGGYSSKIFRCYAEGSEEDKITIRVQNLIDDFKELQDDIELKALEHLSVIGHYPTLHAIFGNGYCYQYIVGKPVTDLQERTGTITEEILQAIAKELAFVHSTELPGMEYNKCRHFQKMRDMIMKLPYEPKYSIAPTKEALLKEFYIIENFCKTLDEPLTLCHGDPHPGNFVWNDAEKKITFVDWEISEISYKFQDIGYFFQFIKMMDTSISPTTKIKLPERIRQKFLQYYYTAWCALHKEKFTEKNYANFLAKAKKMELISMLTMVTFPIFLSEIFENICGPGNKFYENFITDYLKTKKEVLGSSKFGE